MILLFTLNLIFPFFLITTFLSSGRAMSSRQNSSQFLVKTTRGNTGLNWIFGETQKPNTKNLNFHPARTKISS